MSMLRDSRTSSSTATYAIWLDSTESKAATCESSTKPSTTSGRAHGKRRGRAGLSGCAAGIPEIGPLRALSRMSRFRYSTLMARAGRDQLPQRRAAEDDGAQLQTVRPQRKAVVFFLRLSLARAIPRKDAPDLFGQTGLVIFVVWWFGAVRSHAVIDRRARSKVLSAIATSR